MKEENMMDLIWTLVQNYHCFSSLTSMVDYREPGVEEASILIREGPFEIHVWHAKLSVDFAAYLQIMSICNQ